MQDLGVTDREQLAVEVIQQPEKGSASAVRTPWSEVKRRKSRRRRNDRKRESRDRARNVAPSRKRQFRLRMVVATSGVSKAKLRARVVT